MLITKIAFVSILLMLHYDLRYTDFYFFTIRDVTNEVFHITSVHHFYPTPLKGCLEVLFSHMVSGGAGGWAAGKSLSGLYLRNRKV